MSWVSSLISGIASIGSNALSGFMNYSSMKKLAKYQQELGYQNLQNNPSYAREGYEKAGYNPMLAVGGANSSGSASVPSFTGYNFDNAVSNAMTAEMNKVQKENIQENTAKTAQEKLNIYHDTINKQIQNEYAEDYQKSLIGQIKSQTSLTNAQEAFTLSQRVAQDINNKYLGKRNKAELNEIQAKTYELIQEALSSAQNAQTNVVNAKTNIFNSRVNAYDKFLPRSVGVGVGPIRGNVSR